MSSDKIRVPRKIYHSINLVCMIVLSITGWYVHKPFTSGIMAEMRYIHFVFAYIFGINIILRVYYAFGRHGDWRKYLRPRIDKEMLRLTYRHYLLYDHLPAGDHYRILQNSSYLVMVWLFFLQIVTGILLFEAEGNLQGRIIAVMGGIQNVRQAHLFLMWVFFAFTVIHVYMALTEDFPKVKQIFGGSGR